jgi:hypothetical protein
MGKSTMKTYLALAALSLLAGCTGMERAALNSSGDFEIVDAPAPGTAPTTTS